MQEEFHAMPCNELWQVLFHQYCTVQYGELSRRATYSYAHTSTYRSDPYRCRWIAALSQYRMRFGRQIPIVACPAPAASPDIHRSDSSLAESSGPTRRESDSALYSETTSPQCLSHISI